MTGIRQMELDAFLGFNVDLLYERLAHDIPVLVALRSSVLFAVNSEFARPDTPVRDGDEVAFFPPVSGG